MTSETFWKIFAAARELAPPQSPDATLEVVLDQVWRLEPDDLRDFAKHLDTQLARLHTGPPSDVSAPPHPAATVAPTNRSAARESGRPPSPVWAPLARAHVPKPWGSVAAQKGHAVS
jgi:hypothetical protein